MYNIYIYYMTKKYISMQYIFSVLFLIWTSSAVYEGSNHNTSNNIPMIYCKKNDDKPNGGVYDIKWDYRNYAYSMILFEIPKDGIPQHKTRSIVSIDDATNAKGPMLMDLSTKN